MERPLEDRMYTLDEVVDLLSRRKEYAVEAKVYTVAEIAAMLKCNVNYVHDLRKSGLLRFMKLGSYKCRKEDLDSFLEASVSMDLTDPYNAKELTA